MRSANHTTQLDYLSVSELARRWAVRADTVRAWCRRGVLPSTRIGGKILVGPVTELALILEQNRRATKAQR